MSSRERKRAERRKRIERNYRSGEVEPGVPAESLEPGEDFVDVAALAADARAADADAESLTERRNREAREQLEPLDQGDRPLVVTLGALVSAVIAGSTAIAWIAGVEVDGERPLFVQAFAPAILFGVMAVGMWRARYWAVLGFQAITAFLILASFLTLIAAQEVSVAIAAAVLLVGAGLFFWFTVKALARIQMPGSAPRV